MDAIYDWLAEDVADERMLLLQRDRGDGTMMLAGCLLAALWHCSFIAFSSSRILAGAVIPRSVKAEKCQAVPVALWLSAVQCFRFFLHYNYRS